MVLIIVAGFFTAPVWAGCGEMVAECVVIENGTELSESCEISVCANGNHYITDWHLSGRETLSERSTAHSRVIKINGQDGAYISHHILKKG